MKRKYWWYDSQWYIKHNENSEEFRGHLTYLTSLGSAF
jgi:hypothetical protein